MCAKEITLGFLLITFNYLTDTALIDIFYVVNRQGKFHIAQSLMCLCLY